MTDETDERPLAASHTQMTEIVLPNDTNTYGRALGGTVLHWMDVCGAVAAMRFAREKVVTASMDHVDFLAPIDLGEVASVEAYVFAAGRTSVDVRVEVDAEDPVTGEVRETTTSFLTFVALDGEGAPTPVPDLTCPTDAERDRRDEARAERSAQAEALIERMDDDRPAGS
jgi:acyl-CoA hydrolase